MARFGLCGPSYASQSVNADAQMLRNWILERNESGEGQSEFSLFPAPGLSTFCTLTGASVRGTHTVNPGTSAERVFAVCGTTLYELYSNGTFVSRGTVSADANPASMAHNSVGLLVASGGTVYHLNLATNVFTTPAGLLGTVQLIGYSDSYFVALLKDTQNFQLSGLLNGTSWDPADVAQVSYFPDNLTSMIVDHREIILFGGKQGIVYQDTGNTFPFDPIPGALFEQGCAATYSTVRLDNSTFWIGQSEAGARIGWRLQGYTPQRITNHAIEWAWSQYSTVSDAIGWTYQESGHSFWIIYFPSGNATWVYDVSTGMWHERDKFNTTSGLAEPHLARCHTYGFGKHLVGGRDSGKVYEMSPSYLDDAGEPIRRLRRAPHITSELEWMFHHQLQVNLEAGLGPTPPLTDGAGVARDPQLTLRWSDDGGHTWSNGYIGNAGQVGNYKKRVIWRRLGRSRDRIYEISTTDAIPWRIIDGYLKADPGFQPTERMSSQLRKGA